MGDPNTTVLQKRTLTVQPGDRVSSLAAREGLADTRGILAVNPDLKKERTTPGVDPEMLIPGEVVFAPPRTTASLPADPKRVNKCLLSHVPSRILLQLNLAGSPIEPQDFFWREGMDPFPGGAAPAGWTQGTVQGGAQKGQVAFDVGLATDVVIYLTTLRFQCLLRVGSLLPLRIFSKGKAHTILGGVQQRLNNLGYHCAVSPLGSGPESLYLDSVKALPKDTVHAIRRFQGKDGHMTTGTVTDEFLLNLRTAHEGGHAPPAAPGVADASQDCATAPFVAAPGTLPVKMRGYDVTVNTPLVVELPALTLTVRTAFFEPFGLLPIEDQLILGEEATIESMDAAALGVEDRNLTSLERGSRAEREGHNVDDAMEKHLALPLARLMFHDRRLGRETGYPGTGVVATFKISDAVPSDVPRLDPGALKPIGGKSARKTLTAGIAVDSVNYSLARTSKDWFTGEPGHRVHHWGTKTDWAQASLTRGTKGVPAGLARIPLVGLAAGTYIVQIVPEATQDADLTVPPTTARWETEVPHVNLKHTFRPLCVRVTLDDQLFLKSAQTCVIEKLRPDDNGVLLEYDERDQITGHVNHGYVTAWEVDELAVDWKPDVITSGIELDAAHTTNPNGIDMVVIHETSSPLIGKVFHDATEPDKDGWVIGPNYEIGLDGHILKFANNNRYANHAGPGNHALPNEQATATFFSPGLIGHGTDNGVHSTLPLVIPEKYKRGYETSLNPRSIGIEVCHQERLTLDERPPATMQSQADFTEPQTQALVKLISNLMSNTGQRTLRHHVVGHSDTILTHDDRRLTCPGRRAPWPRLEAKGIGRSYSDFAEDCGNNYSGYFKTPFEASSSQVERLRIADLDHPPPHSGKDSWPIYLRLKSGDNDAARLWGGLVWDTSKITDAKVMAFSKGLRGPITELQLHLKAMGYKTPISGAFNDLRRAVKYFIMHTFADSREGLYAAGDPNENGIVIDRIMAAYIRAGAIGIDPTLATTPPAPPPVVPVPAGHHPARP